MVLSSIGVAIGTPVSAPILLYCISLHLFEFKLDNLTHSDDVSTLLKNTTTAILKHKLLTNDLVITYLVIKEAHHTLIASKGNSLHPGLCLVKLRGLQQSSQTVFWANDVIRKIHTYCLY